MFDNLKLFAKNKLAQLRQKFLGPFAKQVIYETEQGKFALLADDFSIGRVLGFQGCYNKEELDFLGAYVHQDSKLLVIGAHVGTLAIPLAKLAKEVVAFEANPQTYELLQLNLVLNQTTNLEIVNKAAGNAKGSIKFLQSRVNSGGSKIKPSKEDYRYLYDAPTEIEVEMVQADEEYAHGGFSMLIMDIEGAEPLALQGCQGLLSTAQYLYIEFYARHLSDIYPIDLPDYVDLIAPHFSSFNVIEGGTAAGFRPIDELAACLRQLLDRGAETNIFYQK